MATKYYLDKSGLTYFWGKVKDKIESTEVDVVYIDVTKNFQANFNAFDKIYRNYVANKKTVIICTYNELATPGWLTYDSSTGKYTVSTNLYRYSNTAQYGISYDKWYTKRWVFTYNSVSDTISYVTNAQVTYNVQTGGTGNYPLGVANTTSYTPTADYHPATKKYVDDSNEVTISSTEPTDNSEIWIDPSNVAIGSGFELDKIYPIGSIYINTTGTNPGTFLGGTWQSFGAGRVLVGQDTSQTEFDTLGETGGSKEMQKHSHRVQGGDGHFVHGGTGEGNAQLQLGGQFYQWTTNPWTNEAGSGNSGNLQPYIVVSMWVRTA